MGLRPAAVRVEALYSWGVALALENVSFAYETSRPVLRDVSAAFALGKVTAIIGPNGAGKSTILKLMAGLRHANAGRVALRGMDVSGLSLRERAKRLAYLPQHSQVAFDYTAEEVVAMGEFAQAAAPGAARAFLQTVGLESRASDPFRTLSAGQQQRATVARALAQIGFRTGVEDRFLLADEPVSAMDPHHAVSTMTLLCQLAADGIGVVVVLHDLSLALRFADEAVILNADGRVHASGACREVLSAGALRAVFGMEFEQLADSRGEPAAFVPAHRPA